MDLIKNLWFFMQPLPFLKQDLNFMVYYKSKQINEMSVFRWLS